MMSNSHNAGMTPPVEAGPHHSDPEATRWPTVIGIISLVYACGGLLCGLGYGISILLTEWMMSLGGMKVDTPPVIKVTGFAMSVLMIAIGVVMLFGAVNILRRRQAGVKLLKLWALLRVALIVLGIVVAMLTAPAQVAFQRSIADATEQRLRDSGQAAAIPPPKTDEEIWRQIMVMSGVMSAVMAIYPIFIMFYLSRRKITNETLEWR